MTRWDEYRPVLADAFLEERLGEQLGEGSTRVAFAYVDDAGLVVKCSKVAPHAANLVEWSVWCSVRESDLARVFGRILAVSQSGQYLLMERLEPITLPDYAATPDIPSWLGDVKPSAFGRDAANLIKVMDYGSVKFTNAPLVRRHWQRD